jgi:hypothetical protein
MTRSSTRLDLPPHASGPPADPPGPVGGQRRALRRADRSLRCLPFRRAFYEEVDARPMSATELCGRVDWSQLVFAPFGAERAEAHFRWLIQLGVLRREVDGQGLTERVRLTPMGRSLLRSWQGEVPRAGLPERIRENFRRHRPRF